MYAAVVDAVRHWPPPVSEASNNASESKMRAAAAAASARLSRMSLLTDSNRTIYDRLEPDTKDLLDRYALVLCELLSTRSLR